MDYHRTDYDFTTDALYREDDPMSISILISPTPVPVETPSPPPPLPPPPPQVTINQANLSMDFVGIQYM